MALGFFNLGPGTRMFGQIGVPSIFWGSQKLGDPLREKESNQLGINIDAYALDRPTKAFSRAVTFIPGQELC